MNNTYTLKRISGTLKDTNALFLNDERVPQETLKKAGKINWGEYATDNELSVLTDILLIASPAYQIDLSNPEMEADYKSRCVLFKRDVLKLINSDDFTLSDELIKMSIEKPEEAINSIKSIINSK